MPERHDPRRGDLAMALEPVAAQVYFSPECHVAYADLGFSPSPATSPTGVQLPDGPAYFTSRGVGHGSGPRRGRRGGLRGLQSRGGHPLGGVRWSKVDASTICAARTRGAVAELTRILGPSPDGLARATELLAVAAAPLRPEGKPLYAGLLALGLPGDPMGDAWRLADMLREYRGDAHTAAWTSAGLDAAEIGLLTEPYWGLPLRTYVRTRAWSAEQLDAAEQRLVDRGLLADGALTDAGRAERESIEATTDAQCAPMLDALGNDGFEELIGLLTPWGNAIRDAGGYPAQGPHELAPRG